MKHIVREDKGNGKKSKIKVTIKGQKSKREK